MGEAALMAKQDKLARAPRTSISGDVFGALINLAGRQRMLSQRIVLNAVLASVGQENTIDVVGVLSSITGEIDDLVQVAMRGTQA